MKSLIQKLVESTGPSGFEAPVREIIIGELDSFVDEIKVDRLGNIIARQGKESEKGMNVMLSAHMDEIGIIVTHVDDNGFARFSAIGGVQPRNCAGGRVRFLNKASGVIGWEPTSSKFRVAEIKDMFIDLGVDNRKECPVQIGDVGVFARTFSEMGDRLVSKAMDDRIGVAILIESVKLLKKTPHQIFAVFSTQEEVGLRGATTAAYGVNPDIGIAIDVTVAGDTPKAEASKVVLGKGPAIKVKDGGMISDHRVVKWMENTARKSKIPVQREILLGGTTDAKAIQLTRSGVPVGCISIPCRYVHSPSEMIDINDTQNAVSLLVHLLSQPINLK
jgi:endoglucanase